MQTLSSARRTCMASVSAVECTATVEMPSSLQARRTRSAISPRLAIRILANMARPGSLDDHKRIAIFDRLAVLDDDAGDGAGARRRDLVHRLHSLDDEKGLALAHAVADLDEGAGAGLGGEIGGADHRRGDGAGMVGGIGGSRGRRLGLSRDGRHDGGDGGGRDGAARDPNAGVVMLDLDLGKAGLVEEAGKLAD